MNEVIQNDIYVDDCLSEDSLEKVLGATDNLKLARGGFAVNSIYPCF